MRSSEMKRRCAVVTAGANGIGLEICRALLSERDTVIALDRDEAALAAAEAAVPGLRGIAVDVGDTKALHDCCRVLAGDPELDVDAVIANAGVAGPQASIAAISIEDWTSTIAINLTAALTTTQAFASYFQQRNAGTFIYISSAAVRTHPTRRLPYNVTKAAVEELSHSVARELGPFGIRSNVVRPGNVDGPRLQAVWRRMADARGVNLETFEAEAMRYVSMRSKVEGRDIAAMVRFLTSSDARFVTGQTISVCGNHEWGE